MIETPDESGVGSGTGTAASAQRVSIAILALGGQGGGVLCDWLVDLAEGEGWIAQTTSVPGVAQRTGATLYYAELFRPAPAIAHAAQPVLALMPVSGDVDVVIAAELMEAGRAMQRGLVTPDRTTLIVSSHRAYAIAEKAALGDGRADDAPVYAAARAFARRFLCFDMASIAQAHDSVISAALFGALAGSAALPFARAAYEAAIRRGGLGVEAGLAAFDAAFAAAASGPAPALPPSRESPGHERPGRQPAPPGARLDRLPAAARDVAEEGVRRLTDYLDAQYATAYLDTLVRFAILDAKFAGGGNVGTLVRELARHLALWMAYEDTIRVADLKTRPERCARMRAEAGVQPGQVLTLSEFMHPRVEEVADTLPAGLGRRLLASPVARRLVARALARGRQVPTTALRGFVPLWLLGRLRRYRRRTLRFAREQARIAAWLQRIEQAVPVDHALACAMVQCARVLKGYGETAVRGQRSFDALMEAAARLQGRPDAASALRALCEAALQDEDGCALAAARQALGA